MMNKNTDPEKAGKFLKKVCIETGHAFDELSKALKELKCNDSYIFFWKGSNLCLVQVPNKKFRIYLN